MRADGPQTDHAGDPTSSPGAPMFAILILAAAGMLIPVVMLSLADSRTVS
jgi:hypothetical protein